MPIKDHKTNEKVKLTRTEIEHRYPRLILHMRFEAILSHSEAVSALDGYINFGLLTSGEAVNHFGGTMGVIRTALKQRHRNRASEYFTPHFPLGYFNEWLQREQLILDRPESFDDWSF